MIEELFLREIETEDDTIEVVRAEGAAFVSVYTGPMVWQIELRDLSAVIGLFARVLTNLSDQVPPLALSGGVMLSIAAGAERTHIWISAAVAHLRVRNETGTALLAALSEARAHVTRAADAAGVRHDRRRAPC